MNDRMKNYWFLIALCLFTPLEYQAQEIFLEKTFSGAWINDAKVMNDGYVVLGHRETEWIEDQRVKRFHTPFVVKLDGNMQVVWEEELPQAKFRHFKSIEIADDGFFLIGTDRRRGKGRAWLLKLDPNGNQVWEKHFHYQDYNSTEGKWLKRLPDGDLLVMTRTYRNFNSYGKQWLHRVDAGGKVVWSRIMGQGQYYSGLHAAMVNQDGTVLLTGFGYKTQAQFRSESASGWAYLLDPDHPNTPIFDRLYSQLPNLVLNNAVKGDNGGWWVSGYSKKMGEASTGVLLNLNQNGYKTDHQQWRLNEGFAGVDIWNDKESGRLRIVGYSGRSSSDHVTLLCEFNNDMSLRQHHIGKKGRYTKVIPFAGGEALVVSTLGIHVMR